jgi:hypothetical protein
MYRPALDGWITWWLWCGKQLPESLATPAIDYLRQNSGKTVQGIAVELDRFLVGPGQLNRFAMPPCAECTLSLFDSPVPENSRKKASHNPSHRWASISGRLECVGARSSFVIRNRC